MTSWAPHRLEAIDNFGSPRAAGPGCHEAALDKTCSPEHFRTVTPQELQKVLDELEASRSSRKRAWESLQEIRWVLQDSAGMKLPPPAKKTIDLEGRVLKDGVRKAIADRQSALHELVHAITSIVSFLRANRSLSRAPTTLTPSGNSTRRLITLKDCCCNDLSTPGWRRRQASAHTIDVCQRTQENSDPGNYDYEAALTALSVAAP
jgi:hypothetical protein